MEARDSGARAERTAAAVPLLVWQAVAARLRRHPTLSRFVLVGAGGYLIYQMSLFLMYDSPLLWFLPAKGADVALGPLRHSDARLLTATLVAAELGIIGVFLGHNHWTFRNRDVAARPTWLRLAQFNLKAIVSTIGIMTGVVNLLVLRFDLYHFMAVPAGVLAAFTWNWLWDSRFIWRRKIHRPAG